MSLHALTLTSYDRAELKRAFSQQFAQMKLIDAMHARGPRVLLKPNFVMASAPDDPSTTHPDFYMSVAMVLLEAGFQVGIGESPAFGSCRAALAAHGVLEECHALGIEVVEFHQTTPYEGIGDHPRYARLTIARELEEWHSLINLPKLKTHKQFVFTAATKNLYGCVVGKRKFIRHNLCRNDPVLFARMVIANAEQANAIVHIADGIAAAHVNGPRGGQPYPLHRVLFSENPLALDWAFARMTRLDPASTPLFQAVSKHVELEAAYASICAHCPPVDDFMHAPLIHISFAPWAVARSCVRTVRHNLGLSVGA